MGGREKQRMGEGLGEEEWGKVKCNRAGKIN